MLLIKCCEFHDHDDLLWQEDGQRSNPCSGLALAEISFGKLHDGKHGNEKRSSADIMMHTSPATTGCRNMSRAASRTSSEEDRSTEIRSAVIPVDRNTSSITAAAMPDFMKTGTGSSDCMPAAASATTSRLHRTDCLTIDPHIPDCRRRVREEACQPLLCF